MKIDISRVVGAFQHNLMDMRSMLISAPDYNLTACMIYKNMHSGKEKFQLILSFLTFLYSKIIVKIEFDLKLFSGQML